MENKHMIIALLVIIIVLLAGILVLMPNMKHSETADATDNKKTNETAAEPAPDSMAVELPQFDTLYTKTAGEYKVEAQKWMGGSVGGFEVHLYKNGSPVNKDSYLTRAYYCMDGEWKWSEWGNGEDGYEGYHRYPVSSGVEIQEVEVKF